ncbi:MAG TPA: potassium transporter TrkG, partial [Opitutales bacterium]|nr:potassium transporter TrkG [Opitutales bacterium]
LISVLALVLLLGRALFLSDPPDWLDQKEFRFFTVFYFAFIQVLLVSATIFRLLKVLDLWWAKKMRPGLLLILTFLFLIVVGTVLLKTPRATTEPITWVESLFTSTSAVCVTGLIVVDTAERFTFTGQAIILVLIQLGGLGLMTLTYFFAILAGKGLSIRDRLFLRDLFSEANLSSLGSALCGAIILVASFETVGAVLLYFQWSAIHPWPDQLLWDAVFHSVSSFCNAGFSTFTGNLAEPFLRSSYYSHWTVMVLVVIGGLGFPVLRELWLYGHALIRQLRKEPWEPKSRPKLGLHTRLVLTTTAVLLLGGMLFFLFAPSPFNGGITSLKGWHEALFNSVTARTAGFNISETAGYGTAATLLLILLMFIGGSPASTAGGIKTTTAALGFFNLIRILKGKKEVELFNRRIPESTTTAAFAILLLSGLWIFAASVVVSLFQPELESLDVIFECVSAFATVGLSRGVTSSLGAPSQIVLVFTMFVGRVGILLFICTLFQSRKQSKLRHPEGSVIIN